MWHLVCSVPFSVQQVLCWAISHVVCYSDLWPSKMSSVVTFSSTSCQWSSDSVSTTALSCLISCSPPAKSSLCWASWPRSHVVLRYNLYLSAPYSPSAVTTTFCSGAVVQGHLLLFGLLTTYSPDFWATASGWILIVNSNGGITTPPFFAPPKFGCIPIYLLFTGLMMIAWPLLGIAISILELCSIFASTPWVSSPISPLFGSTTLSANSVSSLGTCANHSSGLKITTCVNDLNKWLQRIFNALYVNHNQFRAIISNSFRDLRTVTSRCNQKFECLFACFTKRQDWCYFRAVQPQRSGITVNAIWNIRGLIFIAISISPTQVRSMLALWGKCSLPFLRGHSPFQERYFFNIFTMWMVPQNPSALPQLLCAHMDHTRVICFSRTPFRSLNLQSVTVQWSEIRPPQFD